MKHSNSVLFSPRCWLFALPLVCAVTAFAQPTAFTYQGLLTRDGAPFTGLAEMQPALWNAPSNGALVAAHSPATLTVGVTNGLFTTALDFGGAPLTGQPLWLQLDVRTVVGPFFPLTPRQPLTATPYAVRALSASNLVGNVTAAQVSGTLAASQLPASVVTNGANGLSLTGSFSGNGGNLTNVNAASLGGFAASNYWQLTGNNVSSNQFLGSTNNANLELRVNNEPAWRLSYRSNTNLGVSPAVIGGYKGNSASLNFFGTTDYVGATIGGGGTSNAANFVFADLGTVSGGAGNIASGVGAFVGGGSNNIASGNYSAVLGGQNNRATNDYATAMGTLTSASGYSSTAMGYGTTASGDYSTAMGFNTKARGGGSTAMGHFTIASGGASTAMGSYANSSGDLSTAMGHSTIASAFGSTAMGYYTAASGEASTAMGSGTTASGYSSTTMGSSTTASGDYSLAAGRLAKALHHGAFVWADSYANTATPPDFNSVAQDSFNIRARGGVRLADGAANNFPTDLYFGANARQMVNLFNQQYGIGVQSSTTYFRSTSRFSWFAGGVHNDAQNNPGGGSVLMTLNSAGLTVNGTLVNSSDRNKKENFKPVNPADVLEKVVALPISQWNYKDDEERSRHLGPMAQDFRAAFGTGADDKHIATVDADGVALAAIQGLNQKVDELKNELLRRDAENADLKQRLDLLEKYLRAQKSNSGK